MRTVSFFERNPWLCFGPRNKLVTINSPEEVVSPPHNSSFWGQWLCSMWYRGSLTKGKTEPTLIKYHCYQGTARRESWSTLALRWLQEHPLYTFPTAPKHGCPLPQHTQTVSTMLKFKQFSLHNWNLSSNPSLSPTWFIMLPLPPGSHLYGAGCVTLRTPHTTWRSC